MSDYSSPSLGPEKIRPQHGDAAVEVSRLTCRTCGRVYARIDHLERHSRTHSGLKPYTCSVCGKAFARHDALKRHSNNHSGSVAMKRKSAQESTPRTSHACRPCAAAKLKCDDRKPCGRCRHKSIVCLHDPVRSISRPPTSEQRVVLAEEHGMSNENSVAKQSFRPPRSSAATRGQSLMIESQEDSTGPSQLDSDFNDTRPVGSYLQSPPTNMPISNASNLEDSVETFPIDPSLMNMFGESSLADFLNDVMLPCPAAFEFQTPEQTNQWLAQRDFLDFGTTWDDFNRLEAMTLAPDAETHLQVQNGAPKSQAHPHGTKTPVFDETFGARNAALSQSVWRWIPEKSDRANADQLYLSLPSPDIESPEARAATHSSLLNQSLDQSLRDKILALVLSTCDISVYSDIVAAFPGAELLNGLMLHSLNIHMSQTDSWIHVPSLCIEENIELLISIIATGAVISSVSTIRKLGFALFEAARSALTRRFEFDNRYTRDLASLQGFVLGLQIGLWSGDKRRMEIAESFAQPPITMLRRAGRFSRSRDSLLPPAHEDTDEVVTAKWRKWISSESWKRLAIHMFMHDAQSSMAQQISPLLSPTVLTLGLPMSRDLWRAKNACEWRDIYLRIGTSPTKCIPVAHCVSQIPQILDQPDLDIELSILIAVHCLWATVWNSSQLNTLFRAPATNESLSDSFIVPITWENSIPRLLENVRLTLLDWNELFLPEIALVLERITLHMHVSFEQVQLFAGKEGVEEARRVFPLLKQWSATTDARKAVWHAGQVLKAATRCPSRHLRDFHAVCLYHAGMTFWAYAVLSASRSTQTLQIRSRPRSSASQALSNAEPVWLDGCDGPEVQKFITLGRGSPVIHPLNSGLQDDCAAPIHLENQKAVMDVCINLLRQGSPQVDDKSSVPLVENLSQLMGDMGNAAHELLHGAGRRSREAQQNSDEG